MATWSSTKISWATWPVPVRSRSPAPFRGVGQRVPASFGTKFKQVRLLSLRPFVERLQLARGKAHDFNRGMKAGVCDHKIICVNVVFGTIVFVSDYNIRMEKQYVESQKKNGRGGKSS